MKGKRGAPDFWLFLVVLVLLGIGIVMVFSSTQYIAQYKPYNDTYYFLKRELINAGLGLVAMFLLMSINYHRYERFSRLALVVAVVLLGVVMAADPHKGASRWLSIGSFNLQPSELAKLALILFLAKFLSDHQYNIEDFKKTFLPAALATAVVCGLIVTNDLSTAAIVAGTAIIMMWCAGVRKSYIGFFVLVGLFAMVIAIGMEEYRLPRLLAFLHPWDDPQGDGYQIIQSLRAIGSGGLFGVGLGGSSSKLFYLPDRHTDFIFSVLAEELGFVGGFLLILLFMLLIWRGSKIAMRAQDTFGGLFALGLTAMLAIQAVMNIGVCTGSLPVTGITLPFVSYGGTSLLVCLSSVGLLLNISSYSRLDR